MNNSKTISGVTRVIKNALESHDFSGAARIILDNREDFVTASGYTTSGLGPWWIKWADNVMRGQIVPVIPKVDVPLLRDGDLFGEPITNGVKSKRRR